MKKVILSKEDFRVNDDNCDLSEDSRGVKGKVMISIRPNITENDLYLVEILQGDEVITQTREKTFDEMVKWYDLFIAAIQCSKDNFVEIASALSAEHSI